MQTKNPPPKIKQTKRTPPRSKKNKQIKFKSEIKTLKEIIKKILNKKNIINYNNKN